LQQRVIRLLPGCWSRKTSYQPSRWSADNPAAGQCAVTALLIQELLGGRIVYGELNGFEHYWNYLPAEEELDLTRQQYGTPYAVRLSGNASRFALLSDPNTLRRYENLVDSFLLRTRRGPKARNSWR
jgi:hypothetical protein